MIFCFVYLPMHSLSGHSITQGYEKGGECSLCHVINKETNEKTYLGEYTISFNEMTL